MIFGTEGETQSKWFRIGKGPRRRVHGRYPTTQEWEAYMRGIAGIRSEAKPLEPSTTDPTAFYRVCRETGAPCITGLEVEADDFSTNDWKAAVYDSGPTQMVLAEFVGWLFCDSAELCDDGPGKA